MPAPKIRPFILPELAEGYAGDLDAGGYLDQLRFAGLDGEIAADDVRFEQCEFSGLNADRFSLCNARVLQSELNQVSAPVLAAAGVRLDEVRISHSRFGSADLAESSVDSLLVENCKFGWLNLRGATLRDVEFRDCQFDELDLGTLQRVRFTRSRTKVLAAHQAKLSSVDLTGLEFDMVDGVTGLRGAQVTQLQLMSLAPQLADHLGIKIAG
ncbi:pentapeptide repeat-containing protein [Glutamicibacter protophormiae]|uniref:pentapeptide repeat-containing protein n=1 Tax=Glutamicibacter protophormiae TaxID=37930 RepID=UPI0019593DF3|nr:hypothetical protein [Glutamicibacter protophormiae]QRQ77176.1 hypothetical protein JQN66_09355 [Glutamicibacter protophormiae]WPR63151.1 hypothetical protein SLW72_09540 [Glutamicibacter protophormiae]WPR66647.1 hypothetical protein SLW73_09535 [Glutamicibacter protophormiae]